MSTINVTNVKHPSATNPAIVLDADGDATYAGVHDFSAATVTGAPQGLVHINTTTFTAQSSVSIDSVFTSVYDYYLLNYALVGTVDNCLSLRLRVGGVDNSATNYDFQRDSTFAATASFSAQANQQQFNAGRSTTDSGVGVINLYNPALAQHTQIVTNAGTSGQFTRITGVHDVSTAYDGFTIFVASGTITGTIRIYGYKNS